MPFFLLRIAPTFSALTLLNTTIVLFLLILVFIDNRSNFKISKLELILERWQSQITQVNFHITQLCKSTTYWDKSIPMTPTSQNEFAKSWKLWKQAFTWLISFTSDSPRHHHLHLSFLLIMFNTCTFTLQNSMYHMPKFNHALSLSKPGWMRRITL